MSKPLTLSVIIPCWNSEALLKQNLPSVIDAAKKVSAKIIIVDDNSTKDNSVSYLKSLGDKINLICNKVNLGFAQTVNLGVSRAQTDLMVLLNTDVRPSPDCFTNARLYFTDEALFAVTFNSGEGWAGGHFSQGLLHHYSIKNDGKDPLSLWASGGQAMFDRRKWQQLGGMDPLYSPFYWEDVDLGYRAWKMGWSIRFAPNATCVHDHKVSVIRNNFGTTTINQIALRNQLLFIWKNISDIRLILSHLLHLPTFIYHYPDAFFAALKLIPRVLRSRFNSPTWSRSDHQILSNWN